MSETFDVVVIGAGISGASTAYHLLGEGVKRVLVIERGQAASGGTGKSAAIIRQHYSSEIAARLTLAGIEMFGALRDELGLDGAFVQCGWRMLIPPPLMEAAQRNITMQRSLGIETELQRIDDVDLPWLNPDGVAGICYEPLGGYADPVRVTEAFIHRFEAQGGTVRMRTPVRALTAQGSESGKRVSGIMTDQGFISAEAVVNAAGPWAKPLAASIGLDLPLRSIREQDTVWEARDGRPLPDTSVSNAVDATYLRPLGGRRYVIGRGFPKDYEDVDPYNYKESPDESFVADVIARAEHRFPTLQGARRLDAYCALYDVTPDWMPFVGPRAGIAGYFDASGGSGHGFKIGPAIGRELAHWIATGEVAEDFRQLGFDRLQNGQGFVSAYGGNRA